MDSPLSLGVVNFLNPLAFGSGFSSIGVSASQSRLPCSASAKFSDHVRALIPATPISISLHPQASHLISGTIPIFLNREFLQNDPLWNELLVIFLSCRVWMSGLHPNMSGFRPLGVMMQRIRNILVFQLRQLWYTLPPSGPFSSENRLVVKFDQFQSQKGLSIAKSLVNHKVCQSVCKCSNIVLHRHLACSNVLFTQTFLFSPWYILERYFLQRAFVSLGQQHGDNNKIGLRCFTFKRLKYLIQNLCKE